MNNIKLYKFLFGMFFFTHNNCHTNIPTTIFALNPLIMKSDDSLLMQQFTTHIKYITIPLTAYFLYSMTSTHLSSDIINNPHISAVIVYITGHCGYHLIKNHKKRAIESEMKNILQHIFYLIIIGHGMHNLILQTIQLKTMSINSIDNQLEKLELFLQKSYNIWTHLFLEFTKNHNNQALFSYKANEVNILEVLQAMTHDTDIMNCFMHNYQNNNYTYNYKATLELLESKLNLHHQNFIKLQQS